MTTDKPKAHIGKNVKRLRIIRGISQEALAEKLGLEWNQKKISLLENKEEIEEELLDSIAAVLKVSSEYIKEFDEDKAIFNVQNNYEGSGNNNQSGPNGVNNYGDNEAIKKIQELSDRLVKEMDLRLKEKDERIALMQKMIDKLEGKK